MAVLGAVSGNAGQPISGLPIASGLPANSATSACSTSSNVAASWTSALSVVIARGKRSPQALSNPSREKE